MFNMVKSAVQGYLYEVVKRQINFYQMAYIWQSGKCNYHETEPRLV